MVDAGLCQVIAHRETSGPSSNDRNRRTHVSAQSFRRVSGHRDVDGCWVGDDVEHSGTLLGLSHDGLDVCAIRVGVDVECDVDSVETIADVSVDTEYALEVHFGLHGRSHRMELDAAVRGHGSHTRGEAGG